MPLPKASDFDGPVANPPLSGPAVDALRNRKEPDNALRFTEEEFDRNFEAMKGRMREATKRFLAEADATLTKRLRSP
ncbi:MAG: hypothetical protein KF723_22020 [Rhizobiaceae bacterium]|nr:hypothetical protein [Rhizobiaceae bacterium]